MEKQVVSERRKIGRVLVLLYCLVITICVAGVLLFAFEPGRNSAGALGSTCMDIVCLIILFILVLSLMFEKGGMSRTTKLFLGLMLGTMWAVFFDFMTWSLDGSLVYGGWTFAFTIASLCSGAILGGVFVYYLSSYMDDMYGMKRVYIGAKVCLIMNIIAFVLTVTLGVTQQAFVYVDGHYTTGVLYDVITVLPILTLMFMASYAIRHHKDIGIHDVIAVVIYIFIMICGAAIEAVFGFGATYVAVTIADVFIYVMLQNKFLDREKANVEKWRQKSNTDEVTGCFNRHAYEEEIASLEANGIGNNFVYVSMDVNGLKVVNDTLGHAAGDELIIGACACMRRCFGTFGKLFRTGGDEFAALLSVEPSKLEELKKEFVEIAAAWHGQLLDSLTISSGYVIGKEAANMSLHQVAVLADKRMYEDKTRYYQTKGIDRRGQRDAHVALCSMYTKILKVNITDDTYQIENLDPNEQKAEKGFARKTSEWLQNFGTSGQVHPDDLEEYLSKTSREYISGYFKRDKSFLRIFYRRKYGDEFRRVMMELIPANDYSEDSQNLFLYVKDIDK